MFRAIGLNMIAVLFAQPLWAFDCYFTLVKDSCWTNYNVFVDVTDANTSKQLLNLTVPAGTSWIRQEFVCSPGQKLLYTARFTPEIWKGDTDKTFQATKFWQLPFEIKEGQTAWNVSVCYPRSFAGVPLPADAIGNCKCDFSVVPEIQPK